MKKLLIYILLLSMFKISAQAPQRFYTRFGGDGDDIAYSGKPTLDKQYIVAGSSSSYGVAGNTDVYLVKVDSMGFPSWQKFFGGAGNDIGRSVIQLADSGFVITGYTNSFGAGGYDVFVIRTDKNGNQIWQKTFGGADWDFSYDLVQASDGNIFIVGNTSSFGSGKVDGYLLKIDLSGNLIFQKYYGGLEDDDLRSIITTNDNFLATVGSTKSKGEINGDAYFLKLDLNGDTLFTKTFGGPFKDYACDLVQKDATENFDYYIGAAKTFSTAASKTHSYLYRMSNTGTFILDMDYYRFGDDEEFTSATNSYQLSGLTGFIRTAEFPNYKTQGEIFVASSSGYRYKINDQGGLEDEHFYSIEGTKDGGFLILGTTTSFNSQGKDVFLVKHDSTCFYYQSVVGMADVESKKEPSILYLTNKDVRINFMENVESEEVWIIDINGKTVKEIIKSKEVELTINLEDLPNGIYFISYTNLGKIYHKKIVLTE